ncbi:MAG TPA: glycosyltransferase [Vicinamibacterales bacterium]|nr:glycosyltransferase [Vicinamibacterales bacterium]
MSVITPVYNVEPYLTGCIESVLAQTLTDLELIVVDDGSTDGCSRVIAEFAARDSRVRGFRGPNRGVSHARNVAMRHARGRYFALLDGDDEWEPGFARTLVHLLERQPEVAVISGNARNVGGGALDGRAVRPWPAEPREISFVDMIEHEDAVFIMSVFRREVYESIGGFNEALFRSEDYEFWLRAAARGFRFKTHPEPLARYRRRPDSATADPAGMFESIMKVLVSARGFRQRARAEELGAIDRQLERLQSDYLLTRGKAALLRRDFVEARSHFWELYRRGKGVPYAAASIGLRVAPQLLLGAYRSRLRALDRASGLTSAARPALTPDGRATGQPS